jgi:hypothetical protein
MAQPSEREQERQVHDLAPWDGTPYTLALELKRFLEGLKDAGTSIDSGHGLLWPSGAPSPIEGHAEADLWPKVGGIEFHVTVRKSNSQLLKEGVTCSQLGLADEPPTSSGPAGADG